MIIPFICRTPVVMEANTRQSERNSNRSFTTPRRASASQSSDSESDEEQEDFSVNSSSNGSHLKQRKHTLHTYNNKGFSNHLQKQLLQDIQNGGGLNSCRLKNICNRNSDSYGKPSSDLRKRIQNQVYRWKKLNSYQYAKLLHDFGVLLPISADQTPPTPSTPLSQKQSTLPSPPPQRPSTTTHTAKHRSRTNMSINTPSKNLNTSFGIGDISFDSGEFNCCFFLLISLLCAHF
jgi:hypothetical protein